MAKTKPIGVRFDEDLLKKVIEASLATSPQTALNLYEKSYVHLLETVLNELQPIKDIPPSKREIVQSVVENKEKQDPLPVIEKPEIEETPSDNYMSEELVNQIIAIQTQKRPSFIPEKKFQAFKQKQIQEAVENYKKQ